MYRASQHQTCDWEHKREIEVNKIKYNGTTKNYSWDQRCSSIDKKSGNKPYVDKPHPLF